MTPSTLLRLALQRCLASLCFFGIILAGGILVNNAWATVSRVAYIYGTDPTITANPFNAMLTGRGITVDLFSDAAAALATADFSLDQTIIIGDDMDVTGGFFAFTNIQNSGKPVACSITASGPPHPTGSRWITASWQS